MPRRVLASASVFSSSCSTRQFEVARPIRTSARSDASEPDMPSARKQAYGIFSPGTGAGVCAYTWPLHSRTDRTATARSTSGSQSRSRTPAAHTRPRTSRSLYPISTGPTGGVAHEGDRLGRHHQFKQAAQQRGHIRDRVQPPTAHLLPPRPRPRGPGLRAVRQQRRHPSRPVLHQTQPLDDGQPVPVVPADHPFRPRHRRSASKFQRLVPDIGDRTAVVPCQIRVVMHHHGPGEHLIGDIRRQRRGAHRALAKQLLHQVNHQAERHVILRAVTRLGNRGQQPDITSRQVQVPLRQLVQNVFRVRKIARFVREPLATANSRQRSCSMLKEEKWSVGSHSS
jgi:hypothetical protein